MQATSSEFFAHRQDDFLPATASGELSGDRRLVQLFRKTNWSLIPLICRPAEITEWRLPNLLALQCVERNKQPR
jgi:hypothetical protein